MFNGHIDTMPAGNENGVEYAAARQAMKDGRLYGLGATDMKGRDMASVMAVQLLKDARIKTAGRCTYHFSLR